MSVVSVNTGDVRNIIFIFVRFQFGLKKTRILFGMNFVRFVSKNAVRFGYYSYLLLMYSLSS